MNETTQIDFREILTALLRKAWLLILCAVVAAVAVFAYTVNFVQPLYRATVSMYVNNTSTTNTQSSGITASDLATSQRLVFTYIEILKSDRVLERVAEEANVRYTPKALRSMMSAQAKGETEVLEISISHPNPQMAMDIANAVATVAGPEISNIVEGSSTKIIDYATNPPTSPYTPNYTKNAALGGVFGFFVCAVVICLYTVLDVRIKNEEDLARVSDAPVLGRIPDFNSRDDGNAYVAEKSQGRKAE